MGTLTQRLDNTQIHKGLYIFKYKGTKNYFCKVFVGNRKYVTRTTEEPIKTNAKKRAKEIYIQILSEQRDNKSFNVSKNNSFSFYCDKLLEQTKLRVSSSVRKSRHLKDVRQIIEQKEHGLRKYFGSKDISKITTFDIREFFNVLDNQRKEPLSHSTKSKYNVMIKKVMRVAVEMGVINRVPDFTIETNKTQNRDNPRPSFSEEEYKLFLKTTKECIEREDVVKGNLITLEHYYLIVFQVATFLRPTYSELFGLRHKDISLNSKIKSLKLRLKGKTGFREVDSMEFAVDYYDKLKELQPNRKDDDFVFFSHYKNRNTATRSWNMIFNHIAEKCNLKYFNFEIVNEDGKIETMKFVRTTYALRHYSLQIRLLKSKGKINIYLLARNAGTSVEQLERFYLKHMDTDDTIVKNLQSFG